MVNLSKLYTISSGISVQFHLYPPPISTRARKTIGYLCDDRIMSRCFPIIDYKWPETFQRFNLLRTEIVSGFIGTIDLIFID